MSAVGTTFRASVLSSLALVACGMSVASAQLKPPEVPGLRGAPFQSQNPPPDVLSYGQGPEWDGSLRRACSRSDRYVHEQGFLQGSRALDRTALLALQRPRQIADMRSGGAGVEHERPAHRKQPAGIGALGRLQEWIGPARTS